MSLFWSVASRWLSLVSFVLTFRFPPAFGEQLCQLSWKRLHPLYCTGDSAPPHRCPLSLCRFVLSLVITNFKNLLIRDLYLCMKKLNLLPVNCLPLRYPSQFVPRPAVFLCVSDYLCSVVWFRPGVHPGRAGGAKAHRAKILFDPRPGSVYISPAPHRQCGTRGKESSSVSHSCLH